MAKRHNVLALVGEKSEREKCGGRAYFPSLKNPWYASMFVQEGRRRAGTHTMFCAHFFPGGREKFLEEFILPLKVFSVFTRPSPKAGAES